MDPYQWASSALSPGMGPGTQLLLCAEVGHPWAGTEWWAIYRECPGTDLGKDSFAEPDAKNQVGSNEIKSGDIKTQKSQPEKHCSPGGQSLKTYPKELRRALPSHRNLYTACRQVFLWRQKGILPASIRLVGKLTPWFLFILSPPSHPGANPQCLLPQTTTTGQLPPSFSYPAASSWAGLARPHRLGGFSADYEAYSVTTASKQQAFPANLIPGLNMNAFWTSPVLVWQTRRQHSQTRTLVDSHLKAGVKLEREKGRGECSQLVLISVRFQLRFVKR